MSNVQITSMIAYWDIIGELNERQVEVYKILKQETMNNTMIARKLQKPINTITPRVHELREKGLVKEAYKAICPHTKRTTIFWKDAITQKTLL